MSKRAAYGSPSLVVVRRRTILYVTLLPLDSLVRPTDADADVIHFRSDFVLEAKAADSPVVVEEENGDLTIEGWAAIFEGTDRQNENFTDGAFQRGIKSFLEGQAGLCYHHKHDKLLGKVLDLEEVEGKGLRMKARVDGAIQTHPELGTYYQQIKNGSLNALSVGGFFRRTATAAGPKITDMDFSEISVTPVPVHPGTNFAVIAGKALTSDIELPEAPSVDAEIRDSDLQTVNYLIEELNAVFDRINGVVEQRKDSDS